MAIEDNTNYTLTGAQVKDLAERIKTAGDTHSVELTQAEYDALTPEEKANGTIYFITDGQGGGSAKLYPEQGYNTDGAMTQKAATDMIFPEDYPGVISIGTGQPQPGVTSGLMIGGSGIGENSVAILSAMEGHEGSVAILSDACYGNNSVAIAGTTDNDNTFSIGSDYDPTDSKNKRLTGLRNGVMDHDAATVGQLNSKQDTLIAGEGISIAADGKTISLDSNENFKVKQWAQSGLTINIPTCTTDIANTGIDKMIFSLSGQEATDYQIVGMVAYQLRDTNDARINCWPVCQFTGQNQTELNVRWMCGGTQPKVAARIEAWVLLKHR